MCILKQISIEELELNIWVFNHHAQGPELPGGTRHYDLARQLIKKGHEVTIFAAGFHYTLMKETVVYNSGYKLENKDGVNFVWVKTYPYEKNNIKRMINIISYALKLNFLIPKLELKKPDIIIGTTVHPFAPIVAYKFSQQYKVPFVFEIRDLWPQTFIDMGVWKKDSFISKVFRYIEKYTVSKADTIISLSPKTQQYLLDNYDYKHNIYIPNSVDLDEVSSNLKLSSSNHTLLELEKLKSLGKFVCLFTGAIVKSNTIHVFIEVAQKLKIENIQIVLVGTGQEREYYEMISKKESIDNITFLDPVDKKLVPKLLNLADVLLLIQGNVQWGSSNKLFDYLAAKKPIITSLYAQHNDIVEKIGCGYSAEYDNSEKMVEKIKKIYSLDSAQKEVMGQNAYQYVEKNYDIKLMADRLERLCLNLIRK